jgi:hypothetical protein
MEHMKGQGGLVAGIVLTIVSLLIGLSSIAVLVGVGEGANNAITAFAVVSFPLALLAGIFSFIVPQARWPIAAALCGPVALISLAGSWSSRFLTLGALWTVALTCAGAYAGARLRQSRSGTQGPRQ